MKEQLQEIKNNVAVIESATRNIECWEKFRGRELCIIPTDSAIYKELEAIQKKSNITQDGEPDKPSFISGSKANDVLDILVKHQTDFMQQAIDKLNIKQVVINKGEVKEQTFIQTHNGDLKV